MTLTNKQQAWLDAWTAAARQGHTTEGCDRFAQHCLRSFKKEFYDNKNPTHPTDPKEEPRTAFGKRLLGSLEEMVEDVKSGKYDEKLFELPPVCPSPSFKIAPDAVASQNKEL